MRRRGSTWPNEPVVTGETSYQSDYGMRNEDYRCLLHSFLCDVEILLVHHPHDY